MYSIKRIIPCLDFFNGRVVKGVNFNNLVDVGDPVDVASFYNDEGADELVFLDISATLENRSQILFYVNKISSKIFIPLTIGGGINSLNDVKNLLSSGADKVSLNSSVITNPSFINDIKIKYGSQCLVIAVDVKRIFLKKSFSHWGVFKNSGKIYTNLNIFDLILRVISIGAGEILLTSIDKDGTKSGFDLELIYRLSNLISIPIIISGGLGCLIDLIDIFKLNNVESILIASILHNYKYSIYNFKKFLFNNGIFVKF